MNGEWQASGAERYFSAIAGMLLPYKWSRQDLTYQYLAYFESQGDADQQRAAREFRERESAGKLPSAVDPQHRIGEFVNGSYAEHRFVL